MSDLHVDVVVPARDEEAHIEACLAALLTARDVLLAGRPDVSCAITVVLDDCTDGTPDLVERVVAAEPDVRVIVIRSGSVGAARAAGATDALGRPGPPDRWIANTDADSRVPPGWLVQQADALRDGVGVLVGSVVPDPADLSPEALAGWRATHLRGVAVGHVHGANLGVRGDLYQGLGGFSLVPEHEDVLLVERAWAAAARVESTGALPVTTSGRMVGRTPGGYAAHLRESYGPAALDAS
jgi:glycosyltransferase involved in cell wall biosynthesis